MNLLMTCGYKHTLSSGLAPITAASTTDAGVSVGYIHDLNYEKHNDHHWYAMIATYQRERMAAEHLRQHGVLVYYPTRKDGTSFLPNTLFIYTDLLTAESFVRFSKADPHHLDYLHFMYDKTKVNEKGKNPPIVIPVNQMDNFIRLLSVGDDGTELLPKEDIRFREGDEVMVTGGNFKGIRGRIARVSGSTRVVVTLDGVCYVAAAYIAKRYISPITK